MYLRSLGRDGHPSQLIEELLEKINQAEINRQQGSHWINWRIDSWAWHPIVLLAKPT
jgi:hypothetical protein